MEIDLEFAGFLVMQNSLKPATIPVIEELTAASVRTVMITGDNMLTALSVARECGIIPSCDKVEHEN
jgi:cation-transporting ATPase 13A2